MANIILLGVEQTVATRISDVLAADGHRIEHRPGIDGPEDLTSADIVFASGEPSHYLPLLRRVRDECPALPFVIITDLPKTVEWLDALDAGATDYYCPPFEARQIRWVMESVSRGYRNPTVR